MGAKERCKNWGVTDPSSHMLTVRHLSHFARARSLHQALTQHSPTLTLPHWAKAQTFLCKLTILERRVATFSRITITEVSFLHCGRGLHLPIEQLVPPQDNRDVLLPNLSAIFAGTGRRSDFKSRKLFQNRGRGKLSTSS